jgi:hypothetical protein
MVIRDEVDLVGDDGSRSEALSPHQRREALIGRDDEVRLFGADGLSMIAGRDAEADVGGSEEIVERVIDLAGQGPEGYEVGVGSGFFLSNLNGGAPDDLASDEGLPCRGGRDNI